MITPHHRRVTLAVLLLWLFGCERGLTVAERSVGGAIGVGSSAGNAGTEQSGSANAGAAAESGAPPGGATTTVAGFAGAGGNAGAGGTPTTIAGSSGLSGQAGRGGTGGSGATPWAGNSGSGGARLSNRCLDGFCRPAVCPGTFRLGAPPMAIPGICSALFRLVDLTGDGVLDVITFDCAVTGHAALVYLGQRNGSFGSPITLPCAPSGDISPAVGDLNEDGKPDMVVATEGVDVLLGLGDGRFVAMGSPLAHAVNAVAIQDLNADGHLDLALADVRIDAVSVALGHGDGTFSESSDYALAAVPREISIADVNEDGELDIVATRWSSDSTSIDILLGIGDGSFLAPSTNVGGSYLGGLNVSDLNQDGHLDLSVQSYDTPTSSESVSVLLGNGSGTYSDRDQYALPSGSNVLVCGDLNRDGAPDFATSHEMSNGFVRATLGQGDGTFPRQVDYPVYEPRWMALGDSNQDGVPELHVSSGTAGIAVLPAASEWSTQSGDYPVGNGPKFIAFGDFNGDTMLDLVAANHYANSLSVLLATGGGRFAARVDYPVGSGPASVAVGDLNGDQRLDLGVANEDSNTVSVLLGLGDGTFLTANSFPTGSAPVSLALGDLNGDNQLDLVVTNSSGVAILVGHNDGTFESKVRYTTPPPSAIALGDVNGDGKLDLAITNVGYPSRITLLAGLGDATFGALTIAMVGTAAQAVAIGDLTGDGRPDIAVSQSGSLGVEVNLGSGALAPTVSYMTSISSYDTATSVAIGDLTGDKIPDVAMTVADRLVVFIGQESGVFSASLHYLTGPNPASLALGDLNGDGRLDAAVANLDADSVSVMLSSCK